MAMDIRAISDLLARGDQEANAHAPASGTSAAMTPADFGSSSASSSASSDSKPKKRNPKAIWAEDEVAAEDDTVLTDADRELGGKAKPKFDILYKQDVTSEDMYLGMGDKDPSSTKCEAMVVRVELPGETAADLELDVKPQAIVVNGRAFKLATYLPHRVRSQDGRARWVKDKEQLLVTLPIVRKELWELDDDT